MSSIQSNFLQIRRCSFTVTPVCYSCSSQRGDIDYCWQRKCCCFLRDDCLHLRSTQRPRYQALSHSSGLTRTAWLRHKSLPRHSWTQTRPKAALKRLSSVTTVRSFLVFRSLYTANSALSVVCHFLNKLSAISWGAVHSPTLFFTSFSSYEIFPRSKRVFKTNSSGFFGFSGRDCDRIKLERFVLLFPLHQKTKTFSPRISLIVAVMLSSSL